MEIAVLDDEEMTPEERAEIEASMDRSIEQADRGEGHPIEEVLDRLRALMRIKVSPGNRSANR